MQDVLERVVKHHRKKGGGAFLIVGVLAALCALLPAWELYDELTHDHEARVRLCRMQERAEPAAAKACMHEHGFDDYYCKNVPVAQYTECMNTSSDCDHSAISEADLERCAGRVRHDHLERAAWYAILPAAFVLLGVWLGLANRGNTRILADAIRPGAIRALRVFTREIVASGVRTGAVTVIEVQLTDGRRAEFLPPAGDVAAVVEALSARNPGCQLSV
jgi:hypothetical protein